MYETSCDFRTEVLRVLPVLCHHGLNLCAEFVEFRRGRFVSISLTDCNFVCVGGNETHHWNAEFNGVVVFHFGKADAFFGH